MKEGVKHRSGSLKQGVWGCSPPEVIYRVLYFLKYKFLPNVSMLTYTDNLNVRFVGGANQ